MTLIYYIIFIFLSILLKQLCLELTSTINNLNDPLILTPLIKKRNISYAQNAAKVMPLMGDISSYAGFFTVDERYNSNLFFWFFPTANKNKNSPLILWLNGGPGVTSMVALFEGHGPYCLAENGTLIYRKHNWVSEHSVIYIDNPVGTGFSFSDPEGISRTQADVAKNLYSGLVQFFELFPEYRSNSFFVAGESYAGKYVPALCYEIHMKNSKAEFKINLIGLAIASGYSDPKHMIEGIGEYYYQMGFIDQNEKVFYNNFSKIICDLIDKKLWLSAKNKMTELHFKFLDLSGFSSVYNILKYEHYSPFEKLDKFMQKDVVKKSLHVGNKTFTSYSKDVMIAMSENVMVSVKPMLEILLENYRVLYYYGQLDMITSYPLAVNVFNNLNWSGSGEYKNATRKKWFVKNTLAGYSKTVKNFTEVLVRNAGHLISSDQPIRALDIITRFTSNKSFEIN